MSNGSRKPIIRTAARVAGGIFVVGALVALAGVLLDNASSRAFERAQRRHRQEVVERSRGMLADMAKRIVRLPVDPAVIGAIESRHYDEQPKVRLYVWAFGTTGDFLFGVPSEAFARLNEVYDSNREQIQQDGHFANRQEFLRELIQANEELSFVPVDARVEPRDAARPEWARKDWRFYRDTDGSHTMLSTPIKAQGGEVLGNLYMKLVPAGAWGSPDHTFESMGAGGGIIMVLAGLFLWFLLPTWVYVDACERGVRRAGLWSFLVLISFVVGLVVYLIARPEHPTALACPDCGREINGGAFCPYCGRDVSTAFCVTCRYPLKPDWAYCPSCRAEIGAKGEEGAAKDEQP